MRLTGTPPVPDRPLTTFLVTSLEDAIKNVLKIYFPRLEPTTDDRAEAYKEHPPESYEYERDLIKTYNAQLDSPLIFVRIFSFLMQLVLGLTGRVFWQADLVSATAAAFITFVQDELQPDFGKFSYAVLVSITDTLDPNYPLDPGPAPPDLSGLAPICFSSSPYVPFSPVWLLPSSLHSWPCWARRGSTVTPRSTSTDPSSIAVGLDGTRWT